MTQFNLLPDVKLEYLKAERQRRLIISVAVIASLVAVAIMVILLVMTIFQKHYLNSLQHDINTESSQIQGKSNFNKILTVQNQLESITSLHNQKPAASRLSGYLNQLTPASANINTLSIDFNAKTVTLTGTADSLATVNQFVDTLKFAKYSVKGVSGTTSAFSNVVLTSFGLTQHEADYTISLSYDGTIFDGTKSVNLQVPNQVTTRSEIDQPTALFKLPIDKTSSGSTH